jgi:hypothetical protein
MAEIPKFNPQGARGTNFANLANGVGDFSGYFREADALRTTSKLYAEQASILGQIEDERVHEQSLAAGLMAGMDVDFDPENIPEGFTIADKAFREGAIQSYMVNQEIAISTRLAELEVQYADDPITFREMSQQAMDGYISQMPDVVRPQVGAMFARRANNSYIQLANSHRTQAREAHKQELKDAIELKKKELAQLDPASPEYREGVLDIVRYYDMAEASNFAFATDGRRGLDMLELEKEQATNFYIRQAVEQGPLFAAELFNDPDIPVDVATEALNRSATVYNIKQGMADRARTERERQNRRLSEELAIQIHNDPTNPENGFKLELYRQLNPDASGYASLLSTVRNPPKESSIYYQENPNIVGDLKSRVILGQAGLADINSTIGRGISPDTAKEFQDILTARENSLMDSPTLKGAVDQVDQILGLDGGKMDIIDMLIAQAKSPEEKQALTNAKQVRNAIVNDFAEKILFAPDDQKITTQEELDNYVTQQLNKLRGSDIAQNKTSFTDLDAVDRGLITAAKSDPAKQKQISLIKNQAQTIKQTSPALNDDQLIAVTVKQLIDSGQIRKEDSGLLIKVLRVEGLN